MRICPARKLSLVLLLAAAFSGGCGFAKSYRTPGGGADLDVLADQEIGAILARQPAARPPLHLATVRIQEPGYRSYTTSGTGTGKYSVVTVREVERPEDFARLQRLPEVAAVAPLSRLLLGDELDSDEPLRRAAAALHADLLLVYTFDTDFYEDDPLQPVTVVSLGFSPHQRVHLTTTSSAVLLDVRTGYVYGTCEATARDESRASAWTTRETIDETRRHTERAAFAELLDSVEALWPRILQAGPATAPVDAHVRRPPRAPAPAGRPAAGHRPI